MTTRALLGALVLTVGMGAAAVSASAPQDSTPQGVTRAETFYPRGPSASYDGDSGSIGTVQPSTVSVPGSSGRYDAVVVVTFQYSATGKGPWNTAVTVAPLSSNKRLDVKPSRYSLGATAAERPDSTTVRYLVRGLKAGTDYAVLPQVNSYFVGPTGRSEISTSKMLVTVELTRR